mgnify:CR=1 FL=1
MVGGYEVLLNNPTPSYFEGKKLGYDAGLSSFINNDFDYLEFIKDEMYDEYYEDLEQLKITSSEDRFPQVFDWLKLFDTHILTIITIITLISVINMIAVLFILLIEKTSFIGILKALGANSSSIRKIFIYQSTMIIVKGIIIGNILGIGLSFIQQSFHLISLDKDLYYISYVPIEFNWPMIIVINLVMLVACVLTLIIPSRYIAKIRPSKSIRFS